MKRKITRAQERLFRGFDRIQLTSEYEKKKKKKEKNALHTTIFIIVDFFEVFFNNFVIAVIRSRRSFLLCGHNEILKCKENISTRAMSLMKDRNMR